MLTTPLQSWSAPGLSLLLLLCTAGVSPVDAQATITGRVIEDASGRPVAGAEVELLVSPTDRLVRRTVSDEDGRFLLLMAREGFYRLRATRIGLADGLSAPVEIQAGDTLRVILRMDIQAVALPALEVVARSRATGPRLAGFQERAAAGLGGTFITRLDIERRNPVQISHMVAEAGWDVQSSGGGTRSEIGLLNRRHGCAPMVYIDGVRAKHLPGRHTPEAIAEAGNAMTLVHPADVVGIELYRGPATVPPQFGGLEAQCGVVLIWTR